MTTLRHVKAAARKVGAIVEDDKCGTTHECTVEAPPGHVWNCDDLHMFVANAFVPWKPDYADLLSRMARGVRKCEDKECDWCENNS